MSSFDEVRFPEKIGYGFSGGPSYKTTVISTDSGAEQRIGHWSHGRSAWTLSSGTMNRTHRDILLSFFRARKGKLRGFRFKDWNDYRGVEEATIIIDSTHWQLAKTYTSGDQSEVRTITKPVSGTVSLSRIGGGSLPDYTVDYTTGIITFDSAPAPFMASFEFDVPVRFDTDELKNTRDGFEQNEWSDIGIIEIMP